MTDDDLSRLAMCLGVVAVVAAAAYYLTRD